MTVMKRSVAWLLVWMCLASSGHRVRADDALDARFFDARGRALYQEGDFHAALRAFLRAHTIAPSLATAYNVALTADLAGRPLLAWNTFEGFLAEAPSDHRLRADATLRQQRLGAAVHVVDITSSPIGAEVFLDRVEHGHGGRTPLRIAVAAGAHHLLVHAERHIGETRTVGGNAGGLTQVHVELTPRVGTVVISGVPTGGHVTLVRDDGGVVESLMDGAHALLVGTYRATLVAAGWRQEPVELHVAEGGTVRLPLVPMEQQRATGRLVVRSGPDATLFVDGTPRARAPVVLTGLSAGRHRVELRARGHAPWVGWVEVHANQATRLDVTLPRARSPATQ